MISIELCEAQVRANIDFWMQSVLDGNEKPFFMYQAEQVYLDMMCYGYSGKSLGEVFRERSGELGFID